MKPSELYTTEIENLEKKLSGKSNISRSDDYLNMPNELIRKKIEFLVKKASELLLNRKHNN